MLNRDSRLRSYLPLTLLLACELFMFPAQALMGAEDPRIKALQQFLWTRTEANDVVEFTYMTENLKDYFRHKRKVKIREESSRLVSFRFDAQNLEEKDNGKKFVIPVTGIWKNLNEHLIGEILEQDTFVMTPKGWLADEVKFGKEHHVEKAVVEGYGAPKEYRDPLRVLKNVMRAWVERDFPTAEKLMSPDFEREFRSRDELVALIVGPSTPHHAAYAIRRIANADRDRAAFDVDLYEMATGDPRLILSKVKIEVKHFESAWLVDAWNTIPSSAP